MMGVSDGACGVPENKCFANAAWESCGWDVSEFESSAFWLESGVRGDSGDMTACSMAMGRCD